ncbi:MAG: hypothetical protein KDC86_09900, partial [Saprospiraceae bacterium]|nr:hypothetical protein [Saprospiraceae bacterium]
GLVARMLRDLFCLYQILPPPSFHSDPPQADKPASADPDVKPGLGHPPAADGRVGVSRRRRIGANPNYEVS